MEKISIYPRNKAKYLRLLAFCKEILVICKELGVTPVAWGGIAYFAYTKDKNVTLHDIDFLVPERYIPKVIDVLKKKRMRYHYNSYWQELRIFHKGLRVELDPMETYLKGRQDLKEFQFGSVHLKVLGLDSLKGVYKHAAKVSHDKPEQHLKRWKQLNALK